MAFITQIMIPKGRKIMNTLNKTIVSLGIAGALTGIISCGGGESTAGIGGTGITAVGEITAFGSIYVNGVRYETTDSSISVDDSVAGEGDLRLGMVVKVTGTINDDGLTGTATTVAFDDAVQGPVRDLTTGPDGLTKSMTVMGRTVIIDSTGTLFEGRDFTTLANNDVIEVSGFPNSTGEIIAARIEFKEVFVDNSSIVELRGNASNIVGTQFDIVSGSTTYTVETLGADLSDVPGGVVTDGMLVEVEGTQPGASSTNIDAIRVEREDDLLRDDEDQVSLEGIITDYVDDSNFKVLGQSVNASAAIFDPAGLILGNDMEVEVEGAIIGGVLIATEVEARSGDLKAQTQVTGTPGANYFDLAFSSGNLRIYVDNQTSMEDELDILDPYNLTNMTAGDYLELKGYLDGSSQFIASEIKRKTVQNAQLLQGPASDCIADTNITILGVSMALDGVETSYFNAAEPEAPMTASDFCTDALSGSFYAKVTDDEPNGTANEAELED